MSQSLRALMFDHEGEWLAEILVGSVEMQLLSHFQAGPRRFLDESKAVRLVAEI